MATLDPKGLLDGVAPDLADAFEDLADDFYDATGLRLKIRSGSRTCSEQNAIYAKGRTAPGAIETYAPGCRSWHVLGLAIDADPAHDDGKVAALRANCEPWRAAGEIWKQMGGVWGGTFSGFGECGDAGHFEWHPGLKMADACPDPNDCENARAAAYAARSGRGVSTMAIAGGAVGLVGLAVATYVLLR